MEKITLNNYEAYYLDYLEGNLSKEDESLLLTFLSENPECIVDYENISQLSSPTNIELGSFEKQLLKKENLENELINENSIDLFLIAKYENILSEKKESELANIIQENSQFNKADLRYRNSKIKPDLTQIYIDKAELKKSNRIIPMWSIVASIAALFLIFFTLDFGHGKSNRNSVQNNISENRTQTKNNLTNKDLKIEKNINNSNAQFADNLNNKSNIEIPENKMVERSFYLFEIEQLKLKSIQRLPSIQINEPEIEESNLSFQANKPIEKHQTSSIMYGMNELENPIQPITKKLSHLTKKEVDFKISKPSSRIKKSFFIKIGKLEISRNTH